MSLSPIWQEYADLELNALMPAQIMFLFGKYACMFHVQRHVQYTYTQSTDAG